MQKAMQSGSDPRGRALPCGFKLLRGVQRESLARARAGSMLNKTDAVPGGVEHDDFARAVERGALRYDPGPVAERRADGRQIGDMKIQRGVLRARRERGLCPRRETPPRSLARGSYFAAIRRMAAFVSSLSSSSIEPPSSRSITMCSVSSAAPARA